MFYWLGWLLASAARAICWAHLAVVEPLAHFWERCLSYWEEWVMAVVRQAFEEVTRFLNGLAAWLLSISNPQYRDSLRQSWRHDQEAWQRWWKDVAARPSTLNALVASLASQHQQEQDHKQSDSQCQQGRPDGSVCLGNGLLRDHAEHGTEQGLLPHAAQQPATPVRIASSGELYVAIY